MLAPCVLVPPSHPPFIPFLHCIPFPPEALYRTNRRDILYLPIGPPLGTRCPYIVQKQKATHSRSEACSIQQAGRDRHLPLETFPVLGDSAPELCGKPIRTPPSPSPQATAPSLEQYALSDLTIWSSVEPNTILIAANLPTLRPLFLLVTGQHSTVDGKSATVRGSHRLSSMGGKPRSGSRVKELFPTDTVNFVQGDNSVENGLYERQHGGIWKTSTTIVKTEMAGSAEQPWDPESGTVIGKRSAERKW